MVCKPGHTAFFFRAATVSYRTKPFPMRILLMLYVSVCLVLNILFDNSLIFSLAMTTFPVSLYLLLRKPSKLTPAGSGQRADESLSASS